MEDYELYLEKVSEYMCNTFIIVIGLCCIMYFLDNIIDMVKQYPIFIIVPICYHTCYVINLAFINKKMKW